MQQMPNLSTQRWVQWDVLPAGGERCVYPVPLAYLHMKQCPQIILQEILAD